MLKVRHVEAEERCLCRLYVRTAWTAALRCRSDGRLLHTLAALSYQGNQQEETTVWKRKKYSDGEEKHLENYPYTRQLRNYSLKECIFMYGCVSSVVRNLEVMLCGRNNIGSSSRLLKKK